MNDYNYSCALSEGRMNDSCFKYFNITVKMDTSISALINPDFLTIRKENRWKSFQDNLVSIINKNLNK